MAGNPSLTSVTDWDLNETIYAYDDANRMTSVTLPNGVVTSYGYDDAGRRCAFPGRPPIIEGRTRRSAP